MLPQKLAAEPDAGRTLVFRCVACHQVSASQCACFLTNLAGLLAPALEPLMHSLQFMGDLAAHEVIDGDAIHIAWQVSGQGLVGGHSPGGRDKRWV